MGDLTLEAILRQLGPRSGIELLYDIFLYIIFFMNLALMFMQGDKELVTTIMAGGAAACAVLGKLEVFPPTEFGSLLVNVAMFVLPIITAGVTNAKKSRPVGVISAVFGGIYFAIYLLYAQRG
jgi:threonine/homoserine efflux transporter RhtA